MARSRRARRRAGPSGGRGDGRVWLRRIVGGATLLVLLGILGGYLWLQGYLRSDGFRRMVNAKVGETLEVEAEFKKFVWDGMELHAPDFEAGGEEMIRRIELEGLETEVKFAPLLRRKVKAQEVQARRLHVEVDVTRDGPQMERSGKQSFEFERAQIDQISGVVDFGETELRWDGIKGALAPGYTRGSFEADLSRGRLETPIALFPRLELQDASVRYVERVLFLKNGGWKVYDSGRLAADGEVDFGTGTYFFNGDLTGVQCGEVVPEDWSKRLSGVLTSEFTVEGKTSGSPVVVGSLDLSRGQLTALPVLDRIAAYTATERFRRLDLRVAKLDFRHHGDRLELTNIVIATEGLMRIEGNLTVEEGRLDGVFQLGVTPSTLATIPGATHRVFHPGKEGLHWTPVRITGTTKFPREDLSDRLIAAGFEWMYEMVDGRLVLKHSGKLAGEVARGLWDTGGAAARIGAGIIGQGTDILNGVPNPVGPIRNGVGSVIEGILGTPRRPDEEAPLRPLPVLPDLDPEPEKKSGEEREGNPGAADEKDGDVEEESEAPLLKKAQSLLERELGVGER